MSGLFVFALVFCVGPIYESCSTEESPTQNKVTPNLGLMNDLFNCLCMSLDGCNISFLLFNCQRIG